jgi:hypothetical protein
MEKSNKNKTLSKNNCSGKLFALFFRLGNLTQKELQYFTQFGHMAKLSESEFVLQKTFKKRYFPWQLIRYCF